MPIGLDRTLNTQVAALQVRAQRANVLADNLANAQTPGFKARDMDFGAALKRAQAHDAGSLRVNDQRHISPRSSDVNELLFRVPHQPSQDGNTVESHVEKVQYMENALRHSASLTFLKGRVNAVLTALRGQ
jgi:flagellar basal-body rod protein FlgB